MAGADELENRVAALEHRVGELTERMRASEQDAAAARVLAGAADRDVTEVRTEIRDFREQNTRVLNAMRGDLTDVRARVDSGFAEMRGRLDQTAAGQEHIAGLLTRLIAGGGRPGPAVEDREHDPAWETRCPPARHRVQRRTAYRPIGWDDASDDSMEPYIDDARTFEDRERHRLPRARLPSAHGRRAARLADGMLEWRLAELPVETVPA